LDRRRRSALSPRRRRLRWLALLGLSATCFACGSIDPGEAALAPVRRLPEARRYGLEIHPLLANTCSAAACHARPGPFQLEPSDTPLPPEQAVEHPLDLPEPFRAGYYTVLGLCDLDFPEDSQLLRWATGERAEHPGGQALSAAEAAQVISWLRSGGGEQ